MTWAIFIQAFMTIFGPYIGKVLQGILDKLFNKVKSKMQDEPNETNIGEFFDHAEAALPKVAIARRLLVRHMKRSTLKHQAQLLTSMPVTLDEHDVVDIKMLSKLAA